MPLKRWNALTMHQLNQKHKRARGLQEERKYRFDRRSLGLRLGTPRNIRSVRPNPDHSQHRLCVHDGSNFYVGAIHGSLPSMQTPRSDASTSAGIRLGLRVKGIGSHFQLTAT